MNNFDIRSLLKDMSTIKDQLHILQEAQELTTAAHAAICVDTKLKKKLTF